MSDDNALRHLELKVASLQGEVSTLKAQVGDLWTTIAMHHNPQGLRDAARQVARRKGPPDAS